MRILHLTDFHFDIKKTGNFTGLVADLIKQISKEEIDFVVFSGDLVTGPKDLSDFKTAKATLIDPLLKALNLDDTGFFICEGNHDVQRGRELPIVSESFEKFKSNEDVEGFLANSGQRDASLKNHELYHSFIRTSFGFPEEDILDSFYTIHKRTIGSARLNIVTLNSAWRCRSAEKDQGNIFYPISEIQEALRKLDPGAFKIIIMHHPLREFKYFVAAELEDQIYDNFQVLLTGHLHKKNHSVHFANDVGILCCASPAVFNKKTEGIELGFSILDIDCQDYDYTIQTFFYHEKDHKFYSREPVASKIPVTEEKDSQNKLRKTFRKRFDETVIKANELLLLTSEDKVSFLDIFDNPILCDKPKSQINATFEKIELADVVTDSNNYLFFGKDKYGKTSILYKIFLDLLGKFTDQKIIPYYINYKTFKHSTEGLKLFRRLTEFCEVSAKKMEGLCQGYRIRLLIDNYNSDNSDLNKELLDFITAHPSVSIVATLEETLMSAYQNHKLNNHTFRNIFIHEIGRTQIRNLTNKWPEVEEDKKEATIDRITKIFDQLNMPYNYWTVSLFLWVYNKTRDANFHNNFELIQLYIDGLLERKQHSVDKSIKIVYDDLKEYLAFLAYKLVLKQEYSHSIDYPEFVILTEEFRDRNHKIGIESVDLIDLVLQRGIIKRYDNGRYTFRLNGVFEYFVAYYMKDDWKFTSGLINDDSFYLSFSNEFELYSGFNRKNAEFVEAIFEKTRLIFEKTNRKYLENGAIDVNLSQRIIDIDRVTAELTRTEEKGKFVLSHQEQDLIFDEQQPITSGGGAVKQKTFVTQIENTFDHLEKSLFILCRVFRNSNLGNPELDKKMLDYILESVCNLGFLLIDDTKEEHLLDNKISNRERNLIKMVMDLMPIVVQTFLYDALAQNNLERMFRDKLEALKEDSKNNQFKLFIVYYMLVDLDFNNNKDLISEILDNIKLDVLKHSSLVKLYLYLAFKAHEKKSVEAEVQQFIRKQEILINSDKKEAENINKRIEITKKMGRVNRRK